MKERIEAMLQAQDWDGLTQAMRAEPKAWGLLVRALYLADEGLGWRAVEGFGRTMAAQAATDTDRCREMLRRLFWAMNDESGVSGRLLPAALGEAVARAPHVFGDWAPRLLVPLEEPFLQATAAWACGRIAQVRPDLVRDTVPALGQLLSSPNPSVRGHAVWALGEMGRPQAREEITALANDEEPLQIFLDGSLQQVTVGTLAAAALRALDRSGEGVIEFRTRTNL